MDFSKLLYAFTKVVTCRCRSCSMFFSPFAKQNQAEVWPTFEAHQDSGPGARFVFGNVCRKEKKMQRNMSKWSKGISHNSEIWSWMKFKTGLTSIAFGDLSNFLFLRSRAEMDIESQAWLYKLCKGKVSKIISSWKGKAGKGKKIKPIFFISIKAFHHRCCWLDKYLLFK